MAIPALRTWDGCRITMNIYDIAKEAGVSISTVSRVLNDKGNVSEATRKKVEEVLSLHEDYNPSAMARGMAGRPIRSVAVLTVDIRVPHYARTAYTIEREFSRRGFDVSLCNTGGELEESSRYLKAMLEKQVDGIVLVGSVFNSIGQDPTVQSLLKTVPVVLANGRLPLPQSYSVMVDDQYGIGLAVDHLCQLGHREIFYVKDMDTDSAKAKCEGYLKALKAHGIADGKNRVVETDHKIGSGEEAFQKIWQKGTCTGIVCGEDLLAAGVLRGALKAGLKVPQDLSVTGFNNSIYSQLCQPSLTTVDNKPELVAMLCVQLLSSLIDKTDPYSSGIIQPELVIGGSTGPVK